MSNNHLPFVTRVLLDIVGKKIKIVDALSGGLLSSVASSIGQFLRDRQREFYCALFPRSCVRRNEVAAGIERYQHKQDEVF